MQFFRLRRLRIKNSAACGLRKEGYALQTIQAAVVPFLLAFTAMYAVYRGTAVFPVFIEGAKKGMQTAVGILPTMIGMLTAVYMLRASGRDRSCVSVAGAAVPSARHPAGVCSSRAAQTNQRRRRTCARERTHRTAGPGQLCRPRRSSHARIVGNKHLYHRPICRTSRAQEDSLRNSGSIMRRFGSFYDVRSAC